MNITANRGVEANKRAKAIQPKQKPKPRIKPNWIIRIF